MGVGQSIKMWKDLEKLRIWQIIGTIELMGGVQSDSLKGIASRSCRLMPIHMSRFRRTKLRNKGKVTPARSAVHDSVVLPFMRQFIPDVSQALGFLSPKMQGLGSRVAVALGGTIATIALGFSDPAAALTTRQVAEKLANIPVYGVVSQQGDQVIVLQEVQTNEETDQSVIFSRFYLNSNEAEAWLQALRSSQSDLPANATVERFSLGYVYCMSQEGETDSCDLEGVNAQALGELNFIYLPEQAQRAAALDILQSQGVSQDQIPSVFVPIFLARLNMPDREPQIHPILYLGIDDLQRDVANAKAANPELADLQVEVFMISLDQVIQLLKQDNPSLEAIEFMPLGGIPDNTQGAPATTP